MYKKFKKGFISLLSVTLITAYLLPGIADASETESPEKVPTNVAPYNLADDSNSQDYFLTKQELLELDKLLIDPEMGEYGLGIGPILGIIASAIGLGGTLYGAGRYAARQTEVRLGLTSKGYKKNRIYFRVGITAAFGPAVALGFDDHFYGI